MTAPTTTASTTEQSPTTPPAFLGRVTAWVLTVGGALGSLAAITLLIEKIRLLTNPDYVPTCSINPILSCGSVMSTPQAEVFGFPNPILGVAAFPVVTTIGVALLAGAQLPRWFWTGLHLGTVFGLAFVHWLFVQSVYEIGALCPYCMLVWAVTIPIFWYTTLHGLTAGHLPVPRALQPAAHALARYHSTVLTIWFLVLIALIGQAFWSFWVSLLP
ncbi:vitamin K epoxide reductase family protein [Amycolatopsis thermoflava]|uniref:vitamin K epoxide reductase family protein n=1 Tax=Amycolatopsis thermoflava TaxID=84480 RepID=UPI003D75201F